MKVGTCSSKLLKGWKMNPFYVVTLKPTKRAGHCLSISDFTMACCLDLDGLPIIKVQTQNEFSNRCCWEPAMPSLFFSLNDTVRGSWDIYVGRSLDKWLLHVRKGNTQWFNNINIYAKLGPERRRPAARSLFSKFR